MEREKTSSTSEKSRIVTPKYYYIDSERVLFTTPNSMELGVMAHPEPHIRGVPRIASKYFASRTAGEAVPVTVGAVSCARRQVSIRTDEVFRCLLSRSVDSTLNTSHFSGGTRS